MGGLCSFWDRQVTSRWAIYSSNDFGSLSGLLRNASSIAKWKFQERRISHDEVPGCPSLDCDDDARSACAGGKSAIRSRRRIVFQQRRFALSRHDEATTGPDLGLQA